MGQVTEFDDGDQCRTGASHAVEQTDHLRHGRHLHFFGSECTHHTADDQAAEDPAVIAQGGPIVVFV